MPVDKLRWIGGSHFEDEFGALNEFLAAAPAGSVYATGREDAARDRIGGPHRKRRNARDDGLLRARDQYCGNRA